MGYLVNTFRKTVGMIVGGGRLKRAINGISESKASARRQIAVMVVAANEANSSVSMSPEDHASRAVKVADALLAELAKPIK